MLSNENLFYSYVGQNIQKTRWILVESWQQNGITINVIFNKTKDQTSIKYHLVENYNSKR